MKLNGFLKLWDRAKESVGCDVSGGVWRLALLRDEGEEWKLQAWTMSSMEPGDDIAVQAKRLRQAWEGLGTKENKIALSIPTGVAMMQERSFEATLNERDIEAECYLHAREIFGYSAEDLYIDFERTDEEKMIIVAARRSVVDKMLNVVEGAGLEVVLVDIQKFALSRGSKLGIVGNDIELWLPAIGCALSGVRKRWK